MRNKSGNRNSERNLWQKLETNLTVTTTTIVQQSSAVGSITKLKVREKLGWGGGVKGERGERGNR